MIVVISQPMLFPWVGMLEQVRLADVYVDYPDVQFSKGGFTNRVQLKTAAGPRWLAVPLRDLHLGQRIDEVRVDDGRPWRERHLQLLRDALHGAPFLDDALAIAESVYRTQWKDIGALAAASLAALCDYYGLASGQRMVDSRTLGIDGSGSARVLEIVRRLGGDTYVTGHGARHYLDHEAFERAGVDVRYMDYCPEPWPQRHGPFTPYVSGLDLVANTGPAGIDHIAPRVRPWKEFLSDERD